jgi:hypothetical protein
MLGIRFEMKNESRGKSVKIGKYLSWGVTLKRNVFVGKNFADPTIKKSKYFLPNLK